MPIVALIVFSCLLLIFVFVGFWATVVRKSRVMPKLFRVLIVVFFITAVFGWGIFWFFIIRRNLGYAEPDERVLISLAPFLFAGNFGCVGSYFYKERFLTVTQFKKIKLGMSCNEVESLIGNPTNSSSSEDITTYVWKYNGPKRSATYRTVFFQYGKVISKLKGSYRETMLGTIILVLILTPLVLAIIAGNAGEGIFVISLILLFMAFVLMGFVFVRTNLKGKRISAGFDKVALDMSYDEVLSLAGHPHDSDSYDDIVTCIWNIGTLRYGFIFRAIVFKDGKVISLLEAE